MAADFPFFNLPFVAQVELLKIMDETTVYALTMLSERANNCVKRARLRASSGNFTIGDDFEYETSFKDGEPYVVSAVEIQCRPEERTWGNRMTAGPIEYSKLENGMRAYVNHGDFCRRVDALYFVAKEAMKCFSVKSISLKCYENRAQYVVNQLCRFKLPFEKLKISNSSLTINKHFLKNLLENVKIIKLILKCKISKCFKYDMPLVFEKLFIEDSHWVDSNTLKLMDCKKITLEKSPLLAENLNEMLHAFKIGICKRLESINMKLLNPTELLYSEVILDGLPIISVDDT